MSLIGPALLALAACSRGHHDPAALLFSGECKVRVVAEKPRGAAIQIDGIHVGSEDVSVNIPCGEKLIVVEKDGYETYEHYLPVSKAEPLKVTVELEEAKAPREFARSEELIAQVRRGEKIHDPFVAAAEGGKAEAVAETAPVAAAAKTPLPPAGAADVPGGAPAPKTASGGADDLNSVEAWR